MYKMRNKDRLKAQLLEILIESKAPQTCKELSELLGISGRSVRNYIGELTEKLENDGFIIVSKPRVGVYLSGTDEEKQKLKTKIPLYSGKYADYSPEYRRRYILKTLFNNKYSYTIQLFADELYCSKTTVVNDLADLELWLSARGLTLLRKQNQGLWIEGDEDNIREAMMDLYHETKLSQELEDALEIEELDYRVDYQNYRKLKLLFPKVELKFLQGLLNKAEQLLGYNFTDQGFMNLLAYISILISRVEQDKPFPFEKHELNEIKKSKEYDVAEYVIVQIEDAYNLTFPEVERLYVTLHLLAAKIQGYRKALKTHYFRELFIDIKTHVEEMIDLVSQILDIDFRHDEVLFNALILHLKPVLIRLNYHLNLRNPLLGRIKREYTSVFAAVWATNVLFEKRYGFVINEDEVAYLTMHFAGAIGRLENKVPVSIICASGIGTSQFIAARLKKSFPMLNVIRTMSYSKLSMELVEDSDILFTTVKLPVNDPRIVYIDPMFDEFDLGKIQNIIESSLSKKRRKGQPTVNNSDVFGGVFDKSYYCIEKELKDYQMIVSKYSRLMEENEVVEEGFTTSLIERERKGSTIIGNGIAIPHGDSKLVKESRIAIIKLLKPIVYREVKLDLILLIALRFEDKKLAADFFSTLYTLIDSDQWIKAKKCVTDEAALKHLFILEADS